MTRASESPRYRAEKATRTLMNIPPDYHVLFLQGGATLQFSMVPMNFLGADQTADYIVTGSWSEKAVKEAKKVGEVHIAADTKSSNHNHIPKAGDVKLTANPAYVHFTEADMPLVVAIPGPKAAAQDSTKEQTRGAAISSFLQWQDKIRRLYTWFRLEIREQDPDAHIQVEWRKRPRGYLRPTH